MNVGNASRLACVFQYFRQCKRLPTQRPSMITTTRTRPPPIASSPPTNCPVLAPAFEPSPRKRIHPAPGEPRLTRAVAAAHHVEGPASPRRRVPRPPRRGRSRGGRSGPCHGREVQPQYVPQHVPCDAAGRKAGADSDAQGTGERGDDSDRGGCPLPGRRDRLAARGRGSGRRGHAAGAGGSGRARCGAQGAAVSELRGVA